MTAPDRPARDLEWLRRNPAATITVADAAAVLGVEARTLARALSAGQLPSVRLGRRILVPRLPLLQHLGATPADVDREPARTA